MQTYLITYEFLMLIFITKMLMELGKKFKEHELPEPI